MFRYLSVEIAAEPFVLNFIPAVCSSDKSKTPFPLASDIEKLL